MLVRKRCRSLEGRRMLRIVSLAGVRQSERALSVASSTGGAWRGGLFGGRRDRYSVGSP